MFASCCPANRTSAIPLWNATPCRGAQDDDAGFDPKAVGMFAGALQYTKYGWITRRVMKSISAKEGRDTDTTRDFEYTDWDAVEEFARAVLSLEHDGP